MNKGVLFIISGPSGTGKGTVCEKLLEGNDIFLSISSTTRDKRANETDGVTYNFTTVENFEKMIDNGEMLEWAKYNGNYYGTPKTAVEKMLDSGKNVILEIEPQGAFKVKEMMPEAILIFIIPPTMQMLKERLVGRGRESEGEIENRIKSAVWELKQAPKYNFIVVNDVLEVCVNDVLNIIRTANKSNESIKTLLSEAKKMGY